MSDDGFGNCPSFWHATGEEKSLYRLIVPFIGEYEELLWILWMG